MALQRGVWAVVVGIDYYSADPRDNLDGCVADAKDVYDFLTNHLQVPMDHITLLLEPDPSSQNSGIAFAKPSRAKILESLEAIVKCAQPGDVVWFHYSGHWDRVQTISPALNVNAKTNLDEVLCAVDEDIRDVEIDAALSGLTKADLEVLAVLDCCHSGGATRDSRKLKFRCRNASHKPDTESSPAATRSAVVRETWFYRHRNYHVIAACQPYQRAYEVLGDGRMRGALTWSLLKILKTGAYFGEMQYRSLQQRLDNEVQLRKEMQQPMILGDGAATIGGGLLTSSLPEYIAVSGASKDALVLDRGVAAGVSAVDQYELIPASFHRLDTQKDCEKISITITAVRGMTSSVRKDDVLGDFVEVGPGWIGRLKCKFQPVKVNVLQASDLFPDAKTVCQILQKEAADFTNLSPFQFDFAGTSSVSENTAEYSIELDSGGYVEIFDARRLPLVPIPKIEASDQHLLGKIVSVLRHLHSYRMFDKLTSHKNSKPKYEFYVLDVGIEGDAPSTDTLATKKVHFKNLESKPVFVTIFNMTSAWGIYRIFPYDDDASLAIESKNEIPELIIDMEQSSIFKDVPLPASGSRVMRDVLKVFITSKQTSFDHYQLKDLEANVVEINSSFCKATARAPPAFDWYCDQVEILTPIEGTHKAVATSP